MSRRPPPRPTSSATARRWSTKASSTPSRRRARRQPPGGEPDQRRGRNRRGQERRTAPGRQYDDYQRRNLPGRQRCELRCDDKQRPVRQQGKWHAATRYRQCDERWRHQDLKRCNLHSGRHHLPRPGWRLYPAGWHRVRRDRRQRPDQWDVCQRGQQLPGRLFQSELVPVNHRCQARPRTALPRRSGLRSQTQRATARFGALQDRDDHATGPGPVASPTGKVKFLDGGKSLGEGAVSTSGGVTSASFTTIVSGPLSVGTHSITASYEGDLNFKPSEATEPASETVAKATTSTTVEASSPTPVSGQPVTITATVSGPTGCCRRPAEQSSSSTARPNLAAGLPRLPPG